MKNHIVLYTLIILFTMPIAHAQNSEVNYDESKVPEYQLPPLFETSTRNTVESVRAWEFQRRPEIIKLFEENVYGQVPDHYDAIRYEIINENTEAVDGTAHLKEVDVTISRNGQSVTVRLNLFIPNDVPKPAPVFLMINHRADSYTDPTRENKTDYWPVEEIIPRGYALGAFNVGDVSDDGADTYKEDILEKLYPEQIDEPNGMRGMSAWAWGAMRMMDYFERDSDVDQNRSVIIGLSRSGKAALWAGAQDERFSIVISNESGAGGAALSRRKFGETVQIINNAFPHWFTPNFEKYNENEAALPVDQHMLIASIAPRPVYASSAEDDEWADPRGEFLSLKHGTEVHSKIYGLHVDLPADIPAVNNPVNQSYAGYHIRDGGHDLTLYDWRQFLDFADYHFMQHN